LVREHPYVGPQRGADGSLNARVSIVREDIARLQVDAIVNAASVSLGVSGGGIDRAIRSAAGPGLSAELNGKKCPVGGVVASGGHGLPARRVLHTVAPRGGTEGADEKLRSCYEGCLAQVETLRLRSIAFCCLGTGIFHFPHVRAAQIALSTVRDWLEGHGPSSVDRVVFCVFDEADHQAYLRLLPHYFPHEDTSSPVAPELEAAALEELVAVGDRPGWREVTYVIAATEVTEITPDLFLGGRAAGRKLLKGDNPHGVTHIFNTIYDLDERPGAEVLARAGVAAYGGFWSRDEEGYPLLDLHYPQARDFVLASRAAGGKIFVHCAKGMNRSATILAALLIDLDGMALGDAMELLCTKRGGVIYNNTFRQQLAQFAAQRQALRSLRQAANAPDGRTALVDDDVQQPAANQEVDQPAS